MVSGFVVISVACVGVCACVFCVKCMCVGRSTLDVPQQLLRALSITMLDKRGNTTHARVQSYEFNLVWFCDVLSQQGDYLLVYDFAR